MLKPEFRKTRTEVKASTSEEKVVVVKEEPKKQEQIQEVKKEVKKEVTPQLPPKKACGHYELNALMTRMVDAELKDVMQKVLQELPDVAPTETESMFVDTLRNKARDDLKNLLGLNVTKRLLNVFNPLYVKVKFSGKPKKEELREFLKKYNFTAFARKAVNIFAAQVRSIDDFDRICNDDDVRCGSVKVIVSPMYKFTTCPPNLKTNYKDIEDIEIVSIDGDIEMKDAENENTTLSNKKFETPKVLNKSSTKVDNVPVKAKLDNSNVQAKPEPAQAKTLIDISSNKNLEAKPIEVIKKPETTTKSENKVTSPQKSTKDITKTETKISPTKVTPTQPVTKTTPTKPITKATTTKPLTKTNKTATKVAPTKLTPQKSTNTQKKSKVDNDFDELDDYDILALMSEGIVLDECSGSDVD